MIIQTNGLFFHLCKVAKLEAINRQHFSPQVGQLPTQSFSTRKAPNIFIVKKNLPHQRMERREKGLCYNCDEKWSPSYRCKASKLYVMHGMELALEEKLDEVYYDSMDLVEPTLQSELCDSIEPEIS